MGEIPVQAGFKVIPARSRPGCKWSSRSGTGKRTRYATCRLIRSKCSYFCYMVTLSVVITPNILFILECTEICHDKRNKLYENW